MSIPPFPEPGPSGLTAGGTCLWALGCTEFHDGAVERCVGTLKCARVCVRAFAHSVHWRYLWVCAWASWCLST